MAELGEEAKIANRLPNSPFFCSGALFRNRSTQ
jgi:hypothetical protein